MPGRVRVILVMGAVLGAKLVGVAQPAVAQSLTLTTRSIYHAYQVQLQPELGRESERHLNRFYQTLDVGGWGLTPDGRTNAVLSLRYDTDFGTGFGRDTPLGAGIPATDGRDDLDLLYAYVEWVEAFSGLLDVRVGRQVITDPLAWYSLDGLRLSLHPYADGQNRVDVDVYVGLPVRFDVLFSSEPFLNDGIEEDDGASVFHGLAFGGSATARLWTDLSVGVAYRQEVRFRDDPLAAFGGDAVAAARSAGRIGLQESRIALSAGYTLRPLHVNLFGSLIWDLLLENIEQARVGLAFDPVRGLHAQVAYLRSRPRFAGDSIFNFFNIFAYDRARAEVTAELADGLYVDAAYLLTAFSGAEVGRAFTGSELTHGPMGGIRYERDAYRAGAYIEAATNPRSGNAYGGDYRMIWLYGNTALLDRKLTADVRVSFTTVQTDWFEGVDEGRVQDPETTFVTSVGITGQPFDALTFRGRFARNFGSRVAGGYRVYSELALTY